MIHGFCSNPSFHQFNFTHAAFSLSFIQAGTLVHEASHFTQNGGTNDYAYGQANCTDLARDYPDYAVMNADSHEFFVENTPELD